MKRLGYIFLTLLLLVGGCQNDAPMDRESFTRLLVEIHLTDALIDNGKRSGGGLTDRTNYSYYGGIFQKYGIDRATFDSCVDYYSRQTQLFDKIYVDVVDSLNKRLTKVKRVMAKLQANDTINLLSVPDTIFVDGWTNDTMIAIENLATGKYLFEIGFKLDSINRKALNRVESYFLRNYSKDTLYYIDSTWNKPIFLRVDSVLDVNGNAIKVDSLYTYEEREDRFIVKEERLRVDTFKMRNLNLSLDTAYHSYNFSTYIDSTFGTLHVKFIVTGPVDTAVRNFGYATSIGLYKKYISESSEREQSRDFKRRMIHAVAHGDSIYMLGRNVKVVTPKDDTIQ